MNRLTVRRTVAVLSAASLIVLASPSMAQEPYPGATPELISAAQKEGQLTIYTVLHETILDNIATAFQEVVPGIQVQFLKRPSTPLANRFAEEIKSGVHTADLVNVSVPPFYIDNPDWWLELNPELIPTLANGPEGAVHANYVDTLYTPHQIAYNNNLVQGDDIPKIWADVLNPKFRGKGIMVDPRSSNTFLSWLFLMHDTYGDSFLTQLRDQQFTYVSSATQGVQEVAAGGQLIAFPAGQTHIQPVLDAQAPVGVARPWENSEVPAIGPVISWGIAREAPHPNAARVFLSWLVTPAAQKILCGGSNASFWLDENDRGNCLQGSARFISADIKVSDERRQQMFTLLGIQ